MLFPGVGSSTIATIIKGDIKFCYQNDIDTW